MSTDVIGNTLGPFFGQTYSELQLEAKTLSTIPEPLRKGEAALYKSKHVQYRGLHPMAATMLFAQAYTNAYLWALRKREDFRVVAKRKVFSAVNPMDDTEQNRKGLWAARRVADSVGADYEQFCFHAIDYSERASWKMLALPRELTNENVIEAVMGKLTRR